LVRDGGRWRKQSEHFESAARQTIGQELLDGMDADQQVSVLRQRIAALEEELAATREEMGGYYRERNDAFQRLESIRHDAEWASFANATSRQS